jgi:uncharacterized protein YkwD
MESKRLGQRNFTMKLIATMISRRSFIKVATPFVIGFPALAQAQTNVQRRKFNDDDLPAARELLLNLVNADRSKAGLSQLQLDDLANKVATEHAQDMAKGQFLSHWGSDGRKPYHRFGLAGGADAVQENASAATNIQSLTPEGIFDDLKDMHASMMAEVPPTDGHRKTILYPFHTHVGFGLGFNGYNLRLDELFLSRWVRLDPVPREAKPNSVIIVQGKMLDPSHFLNEVDTFFEPLPTRPDIDWLRNPRAVALPDDYTPLRPKASRGTKYSDGTIGDFDWVRGGRFRAPVKLDKGPGIYTIVLFVRRVPSDRGFPGASVCIVSRES